jgi:hypothetical protein
MRRLCSEPQSPDATGADILNIPDSNGNRRNVISEYGFLSAQNIRDHENTYHTRQTHQAQNGVQMGQCLLNSMTEACKLKIMKESDAYYIDGILSGPLLLKLILRKAIIDSRSTSANLQEQLTTLDSYMVSVDCNVELIVPLTLGVHGIQLNKLALPYAPCYS